MIAGVHLDCYSFAEFNVRVLSFFAASSGLNREFHLCHTAVLFGLACLCSSPGPVNCAEFVGLVLLVSRVKRICCVTD